MAAGLIVGLWMARRQRMDRGETLAAVVPSLPLAQAIGRLGNWFNQELYGSPTDLPWGLEIDPGHRPAQYADIETFHPTFLYEMLWNLLLCALLLAVDRRVRRSQSRMVPGPRWMSGPGSLLAVYVGGYGLGRLWIEAVRIDPASLLAGLRINIWMSLVLIAASGLYLLWTRFVPPRRKGPVLPL